MREALVGAFIVLSAAACASNDPDITEAGPTASCSAPLEGATPFAAHVAGDVEFKVAAIQNTPAYSSVERISFDLFFPQGLVPGATVLLSSPLATGGLRAETGTVDASGTAELGWGGVAVFGEFGATLRVSRDGVAVDGWKNLGDPASDYGSPGKGTGLLCRSGEAPVPALSLMEPTKVGPLARIRLANTVPVDPVTVAIGARVAGTAIAATSRADTSTYVVYKRDSVVVEPASALPPNQDVELDVSGVRDVLGRALGTTMTVPALRTTSRLVDFDFANGIPAGAIDATCSFGPVENGALRFESGYPNHPGAFGATQEVLIALPEPGDATRLRVAFVADQLVGFSSATVVRADGTATLGDFRTDPSEVVMDLPAGTGPLWLALEFGTWDWVPYWMPPPRFTPAIARISFE